MLSKNNKQLQQQKFEDRKQRFTIKRFSVGVASVLIGATFMMYGNASADQVASNEPTSTTTTNDALDNNEDGAASDTATLKVVNAEAQPTAADTDTKQTTTFDTTNTPNFTDEMLRESKVATSPATGDDRAATTPADQPMGSIVSSDPDKISTAGYSIEPLPTPTLRPEASGDSNARAKFNVDSDPNHYTFAVLGTFDRYGAATINRKKAYSVVFSTDTEGTGRLFVSFYDNNHKQLSQQELTDGSHTISTYTISKRGNIVEWSKNDGYGSDETLYTWSTAQPTYVGRGAWQSDRYMIPTKVSAVSEYRDKNGTLLGTVTLTGMAGQKFTAPAKQTYDNYESEVVNQTGLTVSGDTLTGRLSNFKLGGENIKLDKTGAVYEAVPGKVSDYYETMPPLVNAGYGGEVKVYDETKAVLKDPSQVTTDGKANGVVKVTRPGFDRPIYIGMDEQYYRYLGDDPKLTASMSTNNATGYYEYNIYTGGTPSAVYDFESLATASATGVEVPLNTTPAVLTQKITDNVTVAQLPNEATVVQKLLKIQLSFQQQILLVRKIL
ncbi:YSIRK-type signal peptide-containing protein [Ligilactobacillus hayakitensis]|uniref:YSIRK-type signal peptide-containing protein n=1 Tax=Ligilactobacillus hayakitensis TaxID=396716 RepID=UPI00046ABB7D|nr:YSIRK-type signal peptide-containing protein [Ligilactobacillus hayakitensis]